MYRVRALKAKNTTAYGDLIEANEFTQRFDFLNLLPVDTMERAVLAVNQNRVRLLVQEDRENADHLVKAQFVIFKEYQMNDIWYYRWPKCTFILVIETLKVDYFTRRIFTEHRLLVFATAIAFG